MAHACRKTCRKSVASRQGTTAGATDLNALRDVEGRLGRELERLVRMEKNNEAVRRGWEGMSDELRKGRRALEALLRDARSTLRALNIELPDEEEERRSPVGLSAESLGQALLASPENDVPRASAGAAGEG